MTADVTGLRVNGRDSPLGLDSAQSEFSWRTDLEQSCYETELATSVGVQWRSGLVPSTQPFGARYTGPSLSSATRYLWRTRVHGEPTVSGLSELSHFETGLLSPTDWSAIWITEPPRVKKSDSRTRYFTLDLVLSGPVVEARAYASALGCYRLHLNGADQTGPALVPRYTSLDDVVEYQVYDVTEALTAGRNNVEVVVSEGRFRGALGTFNKTAVRTPAIIGPQAPGIHSFDWELI